MTDVRPFRALRYVPGRVEVSDVLAPVYDVVANEDRARLWDAHPHAAVKLELTRDADQEAATDYADVAERLDAWTAEGVLARDAEAALYVLRQRFEAPDGRSLARLGFFGALRLEDYAAGVVRPHEQTLAGPKADRLKLLRATRANLSPVFMLYEDRDGKLEALLEPALAGDEVVTATDTAGVLNELAPVRDPGVVEQVRAFMADRSVVIADGHHRYETALGFRDECRAAGADPAAGSERLLTYFSNAYAEGTLLLPIHRLVREAAAPDADAWSALEGAGWTCETVPSGEPEAMQGILAEHLEPLAGRHAFAADDGSGVLRIFSKPASEELSVRVIHREVLGDVFGIDEAALREGAVAFPKSTVQVARDLAAGRGTVALYLNALTPDEVFAVTEAGETLPQKSTYFAPKLATGLVFRRLEPAG